ncbi:tetratricopeptide repeat protein [uncultured Clostridium sp.]|uniref:tetratricopeptide repeat protein n=1 Tax=uncultured Clostridium sp. TaxID=59620 RepID=UPI0025D7FB64|nr:tetratricopeptide repeat protein [uncultured Clostridium sp.]
MSKREKDRAYAKALDYYENGEINKAIKQCDKAIAKNLKNRAAFNLKGLILYIIGDIEAAIFTWQTNLDYNGDNLSKNYIIDSRSDLDRLRKFKEAEKLIKELRIDEAISLLRLCKKSDFNSIKVNLNLAICYMRKGDYKACSIFITEVLKQDRNNEEAKKIAKELYDISKIKVTVPKKNGAFKKVVISVAGIIIIASIGISGNYVLKNIINNQTTEDVTQEEDKPQELVEEDKDNSFNESVENDTEEMGKTKVEAEVNFDELQENIANKDFDAIYSKLEIIGDKTLEGKEKTVYINAKELLKNEGVKYFYQQGSNLYNSKDLEKAREEFRKGYKYASDNYLMPHIVFFTAAVSEQLGDINEAIKMYETYYNNFNKEDSIAEAVYKLAILYKEIDIDKSILYAEEIEDKYSDTMYYNDIITNLLNSVQ